MVLKVFRKGKMEKINANVVFYCDELKELHIAGKNEAGWDIIKAFNVPLSRGHELVNDAYEKNSISLRNYLSIRYKKDNYIGVCDEKPL